MKPASEDVRVIGIDDLVETTWRGGRLPIFASDSRRWISLVRAAPLTSTGSVVSEEEPHQSCAVAHRARGDK
jgi:hypothetical protein